MLNAAEYDKAVEDFETHMAAIFPPPRGDRELIHRAIEIQSGYGCSHSADGLYIALAEELNAGGPAEFLTFDKDSVTQVLKNAPIVKVNLLPI